MRAGKDQEGTSWNSSARSLDSPDRRESIKSPRRCINEVRNGAWRTPGIRWRDSAGKLLFSCKNNYGKCESGSRRLTQTGRPCGGTRYAASLSARRSDLWRRARLLLLKLLLRVSANQAQTSSVTPPVRELACGGHEHEANPALAPSASRHGRLKFRQRRRSQSAPIPTRIRPSGTAGLEGSGAALLSSPLSR